MDTCKQSLAINKCANFLQTLLRLTDKQVVRGPHNEETSQYELIRQLIRVIFFISIYLLCLYKLSIYKNNFLSM